MNPSRKRCSLKGCDKDVAARTMCNTHYYRAKRRGDQLPPSLHESSPQEYIEKNIERNAANSCWNWTGCLDKDGYGYGTHVKKTSRAHRFSYEVFVGPIADGLVIDHLCRNRRCVNPDHLEPVTVGENSHRGALYPSLRGIRGCRTHGMVDGRIEVRTRDGKEHRRWQCRVCNRAAQKRSYRRRTAS